MRGIDSVMPPRYPNVEIAAPANSSDRAHAPSDNPAASASGEAVAFGSSAPSTPCATTWSIM